jgi:hypothetical protein
MKLFKIKYVLTNNNVMTVVIVSHNREGAIKYLRDHQKNIARIEDIMIGDDIHAIEETIIDTYINNTSKVKKLKEQLQYLKNCLVESDEIIENLRSAPVEQPVNVNEVGMLHDKIIELEQKNIELSQNSSNTSNEKIEAMKNDINRLEKEVTALQQEKRQLIEESNKKTEIKKVFLCPECSQEFKTPVGVKQHYTKKHKKD